jgi:hypothetical protein
MATMMRLSRDVEGDESLSCLAVTGEHGFHTEVRSSRRSIALDRNLSSHFGRSRTHDLVLAKGMALDDSDLFAIRSLTITMSVTVPA